MGTSEKKNPGLDPGWGQSVCRLHVLCEPAWVSSHSPKTHICTQIVNGVQVCKPLTLFEVGKEKSSKFLFN